MNPNPVSSDLRRACAELGPQAEALLARYRDPHFTARQRDCALLEVIWAYRLEPKRWSPLLLELLGPAIAQRLPSLPPLSPAVSDEDMRQQMVLEVLRAAATMPLARDARFVERAVMLRAAEYAGRMRANEWRFRERHRPAAESDELDDWAEEL